ncbi:hypothetical protein QYF36_018340 [Acer negundo]|nr:hypothetical protein QYF36_018340 [Acer negundo]
MPWEGYNFEDAVLISERLIYRDIYTSFHIRKYEIQTHVTSQGPERITNEIPHLEVRLLRNLDKNGIVMLGSWVETGDILVGKLTPQTAKESSYAPEDRLLRAILGIQKREIKVGDKVAGRHGNKGIISKILPRQDMPYLQDGRPVDMVFNPLGVPSRMNIGQIFECSISTNVQTIQVQPSEQDVDVAAKDDNSYVGSVKVGRVADVVENASSAKVDAGDGDEI